MRASLLAALLFTLLPVNAAAVIADIQFHGFGRVTHSRVGDNPDFPTDFIPPAIGTPVSVTGSIFFNEPVLPDDYTGSYQFDEYELGIGQQGFRWNILGGVSYGESGWPPYQGGSLSFVSGRLTGINVFVDGDGPIDSLSTGTWEHISTRLDMDWGGTWALSVPEPSSWVLMIAGFGLAGLRLRSRTVAA